MCLGNHDYGNYWDQFFRSCSHNQIEYGIQSQKDGKMVSSRRFYSFLKNKMGLKWNSLL